jgi:hypothetical protein
VQAKVFLNKNVGATAQQKDEKGEKDTKLWFE